MDNEIQLISDGDGLAVIGNRTDVERFLVSEGLLSLSEDLGLQRLGPALGTSAAVVRAGSEIAANSGRWLKQTKESAQLVKKLGLRESSKTGLSTGVLKGNKGQVGGFVEFENRPGSLLANPAILAGAAGIMAQLARQHEMNEIKKYLATIDVKVGDVLRAQKDAALAKMIGVDLVIDEVMSQRKYVVRINETMWHKVQGAPETIAETQAYALRQLDALAEKLESKIKIRDLAKTAEETEPKVREWLAVLARCFQLQDAIAVLELEWVLHTTPDDLDGHRLGLKDARQKRRELILQSTERLMARMDSAAGTANSKVLLHSPTAQAVVGSINHVGITIDNFHRPLGIEFGRHPLEATQWWDAARDPRQLKNAATEAGRIALVGAGVAGLGALGVLAKNAMKRG
jgi:hypothetical protein